MVDVVAMGLWWRSSCCGGRDYGGVRDAVAVIAVIGAVAVEILVAYLLLSSLGLGGCQLPCRSVYPMVAAVLAISLRSLWVIARG
jgi:hypothetical protein